MAKANTYELEHNGYTWVEDGCKVCGGKNGSPYRLFYYPTFMNGDAEWEADFCQSHKGAGYTLLNELRNNLKNNLKK